MLTAAAILIAWFAAGVLATAMFTLVVGPADEQERDQ